MSEKPNRARRSPQEKKRLSYERDRMNVYARNKKSGRRAVRKRKMESERILRRNSAEILHRAVREDIDEMNIDARLSDVTIEALRHSRWRKIRDMPIGVLLDKRPMQRHGGADRVPTRNIREAYRGAIECAAKEEELIARWREIMAERRAAKNSARNAKRKARKAAEASRRAERE